MNEYGEVITDIGASSAPANAAPAPGEQPTPVDPNDPRLTSEELTDTGADVFAAPPKLPDGKWRAKAKSVDIKDPKTGQQQRYLLQEAVRKDGTAWQTDPNTGKPSAFMCTNVEFSVIDHSGSFDGVKLTEYWIRTLVDPRKGSSQAATLTRKLGGKTPPSFKNHMECMDLLLKTLAGEPEVILETAWSAECQTCQEVAKKTGARAPKAILVGMHRFPATKVPGEKDPIVTCPTCKSQVAAQVTIANFWSLTEAKPTHGTGQSAAKK